MLVICQHLKGTSLSSTLAEQDLRCASQGCSLVTCQHRPHGYSLWSDRSRWWHTCDLSPCISNIIDLWSVDIHLQGYQLCDLSACILQRLWSFNSDPMHVVWADETFAKRYSFVTVHAVQIHSAGLWFAVIPDKTSPLLSRVQECEPHASVWCKTLPDWDLCSWFKLWYLKCEVNFSPNVFKITLIQRVFIVWSPGQTWV